MKATITFVDFRNYLLSIRGLGLKSVECVRLLTLQNLAFPVSALYELHYQMITFGKYYLDTHNDSMSFVQVFCTKSKPNCNACPMRGECKHFASAYARFVIGKTYIAFRLGEIPCRTAMRGSFPLNGTYFQVNEVS
ncbi:hypothetical protein GW17_00027153 [Ensete ventricosum]|nr:hypothetical protein GW17_00027153 [Ensete ventricosum]